MSSFIERLMNRTTHETEVATPEPGAAMVPVHWLDVTERESKDKPCALGTLDIVVRATGLHAEVVQTLRLDNPNQRPISVSVGIPMPDGAVVCGYALEIDGQMVDGVVVEREQARVAFETEQRRGADPGLVEAVRGNLYRTRVYPVPAKGSRSLRLRYVTPLTLAADGSAHLDVPMPAEAPATCSLAIDVEQLGKGVSRPIVSGIEGTALVADSGGQAWSLHYETHDVAADGPVRVTLPELPRSFVLLERDDAGDVWFVASEAPSDEPPGGNDGSVASPLTALTVLWDASGSRAETDHGGEFELLRTYAATTDFETLRLVTFADRVHEVRDFASVDDLVRHLEDLRYDGATNLAALACELEAWPHADACLLFSDGLDTFSGEAFALPKDCRVLAVVSGAERDFEALRQACHGLAFDLAHAPKDAAALARTLDPANPRRTLDVRGTGIADVCDAGIAGTGGGTRRCVIGRLAEDTVDLTLGADGAAFALDARTARAGNVLAAAWAARRVSQLSVRASENASELLSLGRRFGVVSPATSLLVLEELDQWLRYDIEPPATWKRMHDAWERARKGRMNLSNPQAEREEHRRRLADQWAETRTWWESDHRVSAARRCPLCGAWQAEGARFCPSCGRLLVREDERARRWGDTSGEALPDGMPDALPDCLPDAMPRSARSDTLSARRAMRHLRRAIFEAEPEEEGGSWEAESALESAAPTYAAAASAAPGDTGSFSGTLGLADSEESEASPVSDSSGPASSVRIRAWMPDAPYLKALDEAFASENALEVARDAYFEQRTSYRTSPSFFLDCAGWFIAHDDVDFGISVLTNLAELRVDDPALLRVMGWRLREAGRLELALATLRRVLQMRREDSQSHRDVALVLDELARATFAAGDEDGARAYANEAGDVYRHVALTPWQRRPMAIGLFAVEEYNVLRAWADAQTWTQDPELPSLGEDLEGVLDSDLRITLAWDADETDVDLHVTEPLGEEAYYGHRFTSSGGRVSEDITDGFGPELYEIRRAQEGVYQIRAHYYASHQQTIFGPATCTLTVYTDWGRPTQERRVTTTRLDSEKEMTPVGTAAYGTVAEGEADAESGGESQGASRVERGMTADEVVALLGEPANRSDERWIWELSGGRRLAVEFVEGVVGRVLERMPWGEDMILAQ